MRWHTVWSFILLMLFSGATYLTYLVHRTGGLNPVFILEQMTTDLETLGPAAFLLDFIVLYLIVRWIRNRRRKLNRTENHGAFADRNTSSYDRFTSAGANFRASLARDGDVERLPREPLSIRSNISHLTELIQNG